MVNGISIDYLCRMCDVKDSMRGDLVALLLTTLEKLIVFVLFGYFQRIERCVHSTKSIPENNVVKYTDYRVTQFSHKQIRRENINYFNNSM